MTSWRCNECGFALYLPIAAPRLTSSFLGLYSDGRFPGRCLLVFNRHVEHLESLEPADSAALWNDVSVVGRTVRRITGAAKINYAVLGNATPHLHVHIIPRQPSEELPTRPPWNDPRAPFEISPASAREMQLLIGAALT